MNNLHPIFQQALAPWAPRPATDALGEYREALARFDWQYEFSDEHRVWAKGTNDLARLRKMQRELDPTGEIWMACAGAQKHGAPQPFVGVAA